MTEKKQIVKNMESGRGLGARTLRYYMEGKPHAMRWRTYDDPCVILTFYRSNQRPANDGPLDCHQIKFENGQVTDATRWNEALPLVKRNQKVDREEFPAIQAELDAGFLAAKGITLPDAEAVKPVLDSRFTRDTRPRSGGTISMSAAGVRWPYWGSEDNQLKL